MAKPKPRSFACPVCGEEVPGGSKSCPECGACEKSGWSGTGADDLPDDEFDYDEFVANEFGSGPKKSQVQWMWVIVAAVLFVVLAWGLLR